MHLLLLIFLLVFFLGMVLVCLQDRIQKLLIFSFVLMIIGLTAQLLFPAAFDFSERPIWVLEPVFGFWYTVNFESVTFRLLRDVFGLEFSFLVPESIIDFIIISVIGVIFWNILIIKENPIEKLKVNTLFLVGIIISTVSQVIYGPGAHDFIMFAFGNTAFITDVRDIIIKYVFAYWIVLELKKAIEKLKSKGKT